MMWWWWWWYLFGSFSFSAARERGINVDDNSVGCWLLVVDVFEYHGGVDRWCIVVEWLGWC